MAFQLTAENLTRITDFIAIKQPARVIKQTPAPGTPVLEGMTIEVHAVSYSDVPYHVLDATAPAALRSIPIADIDKIIASDDALKAAVATGTVSDPAFPQKFNSALVKHGIAETLSATDAAALVKSLNVLGFRGL